MHLTWRERLNAHAHLWDFGSWPVIDVNTLPTRHRSTYLRNRRMVIAALTKRPLKQIAHQSGLSVPAVTHILNRCLGGDEYDEPALTAALVPFARTQDNHRRVPLPALGDNTGAPNAFRALLTTVPGLRSKLDEMIEAKLRDARYAQILTPATFHAEFKRILISAGHPQHLYPYTTDSLAYESCRIYFHKRMDAIRLKRINKRSVRVVNAQKRAHYCAGRQTQIDEHTVDLQFNIQLALNDEMIPLRASRVQIVAAKDVDTDCILGIHVALARCANQDDMLGLLDKCLQPSTPLPLDTPGLSYTPGASFPSCIAPMGFISLGEVQLDNALSHLANTVKHAICDQHVAAFSMGLGGQPKTRNWIEGLFREANHKLSHRFASTTGSHPADSKKESPKNRKTIPDVSWQAFEEALHVVATHYNVSPKKHLGGATPLALYQSHLQQHYVRYTPEAFRTQWQPFMASKTVKIKWLKDEHRAPHVNFLGVRYQGECLNQAVTKHACIDVEYDRRDIRTLIAKTESGHVIGTLEPPSSWRRFPHSVATRLHIMKLVRKKQRHTPDPLADYFRLALENKGTPKGALHLLKVYEELTSDQASKQHIMSLVPHSDTQFTAGDAQGRARRSGDSVKRPWVANSMRHRSA